MKNKFESLLTKLVDTKLGANGVAAILFAIIMILALGVSWIATCGIIKLITVCFGWTFRWSISTGIWLLILLLKGVFSNNVTVKK